MLVTTTLWTVFQLATQLRISSCHHFSQGFDRSISQESDAERFMVSQGLGQATNGRSITDLPDLDLAALQLAGQAILLAGHQESHLCVVVEQSPRQGIKS